MAAGIDEELRRRQMLEKARAELIQFAGAMAARSTANDKRGGWRVQPTEAQLLELYGTVGELQIALLSRARSGDRRRERIAAAAADVANAAMHLALSSGTAGHGVMPEDGAAGQQFILDGEDAAETR